MFFRKQPNRTNVDPILRGEHEIDEKGDETYGHQGVENGPAVLRDHFHDAMRFFDPHRQRLLPFFGRLDGRPGLIGEFIDAVSKICEILTQCGRILRQGIGEIDSPVVGKIHNTQGHHPCKNDRNHGSQPARKVPADKQNDRWLKHVGNQDGRKNRYKHQL